MRARKGARQPEDSRMSPKVQYEIVIEGPIGAAAAAGLEGFRVVLVSGGTTTLRGWVVDQAGLHGVLDRMSGLGIEFSSVAPVEE